MPKRLAESNINTPEFFNRIWKEEIELRPPQFDAVRMRALVAPARNGDYVLDIGAGLCGAVQFIAEATDLKCHLYALDFCELTRDFVIGRCPQIEFHIGDAMALPFPTGFFDLVIASEIIEHLEDTAGFVRECARVCRSGGTLTMSTVNPHCDDAIRNGCKYPEHVWEFTPEELKFAYCHYGDAVYEEVGNYHTIRCRRF